MLRRSLRKLRQQPKSTRDNIAFIVAGSLSGIVALVWLYHVPVKVGEGTAGIASDIEESQPGFMNLFGDFGSQIATVKESLTEAQENLVAEESEATATSTATEAQAEEILLQDEDIAEEVESIVATTTTTTTTTAATTSSVQPRTVRIITTNEEPEELPTGERP